MLTRRKARRNVNNSKMEKRADLLVAIDYLERLGSKAQEARSPEDDHESPERRGP